jgi:hypothetical protein
MNHDPDLGEQLLDKAAELALTSQLDEVEEIEVDIRTNPLQLVQGQVDSVKIQGQGLVIQQELRAESVDIQTDAVFINPLKAVTGDIELNKTACARTQVILTEADLNRALQSDYLRNKLNQLEVEVDGEIVPIDIQHVSLQLLSDNRIDLNAIISTDHAKGSEFHAMIKPVLKDNGQRIEIEILSAEGQGLSLTLLTVLFQNLIELLDLRNFELGGVSLKLKELETDEGRLLIRADTTIAKLPPM